MKIEHPRPVPDHLDWLPTGSDLIANHRKMATLPFARPGTGSHFDDVMGVSPA